MGSAGCIYFDIAGAGIYFQIPGVGGIFQGSGIHQHFIQQQIDAGSIGRSRITSYNVCYTKLLRDLTAPAAGKAHVRFIHLSPDAPAVDITLSDGTVLFGNYEFKQATGFTPLDAATYNLQVSLAGTSTVVLDRPGITLEDGKIYTVFSYNFV